MRCPAGSFGYQPLAPFLLKRRLNEVTLAVDAFGIPAFYGPPGMSGTLPVAMGTPYPESFPNGGVNLSVIPFACTFTLDTLAQKLDIQGMFRDYQLVALDAEFAFLAAGAYNQGIAAPAPELHLYTDPTDAVPPATIQTADAYEDLTRRVLTQQTTCYRTQPKPAVMVYDSAVATSYAYPAQNSKLWLSTQDLSTPHYGFKGLFRNYSANAGNGNMVRISFTAYIRVRRPH